ncbi:hypothetical protein RB653_002966 [Dictyostelium firmibasis]|uniref:Uncharacterized protein n=1 Tax=Dictyostelium firmibasis TaxID=79012 RepID=A0AAN7YT66_9MYCE
MDSNCLPQPYFPQTNNYDYDYLNNDDFSKEGGTALTIIQHQNQQQQQQQNYHQQKPIAPPSSLISQQSTASCSQMISQSNHNKFQLFKEFKENTNNIDSKMLCVQLSEFQISPKTATNSFDLWLNSLWLPPTGFKKLVDNHLEKVYIPFYSYRISYNVEFSGFVTYDSKLNTNAFYDKFGNTNSVNNNNNNNNNNNHNNHNNNNGNTSNLNYDKNKRTSVTILNKENSSENNVGNNNNLKNYEDILKDKSIKWNKVDGYITRTINRILLLACNSMDLLSDESIMNCMASQQFDFNNVIEKTLEEFNEFSQLEQINVLARYEPDSVWKRDYLNHLLETEQSMSIEYLKQQEQSKFVKNVSSNIQFNEKMFSLIYIPFYYTKYEYQNQSFSFFLNAQNGVISATRPEIGLGKIGDFLKYTQNYFSTLVGYLEPFSKCKGGDLATIDSTKVYNDSSYYLCFARSSTNFLGSSSIGHLTLRNNSSLITATLRGQKRRGILKGNPFTLLPLHERTFSFKGHWCFEIIEGEVNQIDVIKINPREGGSIYQSIKN